MATDRLELFERIKHALVTTPDTVALVALINRAPFLLDDDFLAAAQGWADEAERGGGLDLAEGLRERLDALREIKAQI